MTTLASPLINEDQLKAWLGYERRADIERKLREMGIRFRRGRDGAIITTMDAVNAAFLAANDFGDIQFGEPDGSQAQHAG